MKQYSFLLFEGFGGYARRGIKDIYKTSKEKYLDIRQDNLNNINNNCLIFLTKLISIDNLDVAKSIVKREKIKLKFSKIPKDVLNHIELILNNSDEFDYADKLMIYKNSLEIL